jgi:hypothetical protein
MSEERRVARDGDGLNRAIVCFSALQLGKTAESVRCPLTWLRMEVRRSVVEPMPELA